MGDVGRALARVWWNGYCLSDADGAWAAQGVDDVDLMGMEQTLRPAALQDYGPMSKRPQCP